MSLRRSLPGGGYALALLSLAIGACLPRGEPPAGHQILADHDASLLGFAAPTGDGVTRVLFFRPGDAADLVDLWALALDENGGPVSELLLQKGISSGYQLGYRPAVDSGTFPTDAQGRIYFGNIRVDPATGEATDLGGSLLNLSTDKRGYLVEDDSGGFSVHRADGSVVEIVDGMFPQFYGDSVYYLTFGGDLIRVPPAGGPEVMATGNLYSFYPLPGNPRLWMLLRSIPDPNSPMPVGPVFGPGAEDTVTAAVLDTSTGIETALPDGMAYQFGAAFSPDGRWLVTSQKKASPGTDLGSYTDVLIDRLTGTVEVLEQSFRFGAWRPGHEELWAAGYDAQQPGLAGVTLFIKRPGQPVAAFPGVGYGVFSVDGTYWISSSTPPTEQVSEQVVGLADDPAGPKVRMVPPKTSLTGMWALPDGRMVVESVAAAADYFEDFFVNVVDPATGVMQLVGERGIPEAIGKTRVLGLFQASYERGDLISFDVATGRSITLAPEFAMGAVVEPDGDDHCPPGARVLYQYRARFDSPWDGLWVATMP